MKKATSIYIFLLEFAETTDTLLKGINNKRKKNWRQKDFKSHVGFTKPEWVEPN